MYFITSVTHGRYPFFRKPIFAGLFVVDLWFARKIKQFRLYGYTVAGDHVHLLVQPFGSSNISDVMASLKRNVSRDINDVIQGRARTVNLAGDDSNRPLPERSETIGTSVAAMKAAHPTLDAKILERHFELLRALRLRFAENSATENGTIVFRWQKSFYDHVIRGEHDFLKHLEYIFSNAVKHKLTKAAEDWPWMWVFGMDEPKEFQ